MSKGIFITGTDTGVGKTYIAAGMAKALRDHQLDVGVMKPAETGCRMHAGKLQPRDALSLLKASGARDALDLVNPYRFRRPLAPSVAAELDNRTIDPDRILSAYRILDARHEFIIVEGAGGIMAPLTQGYLFLDLAEALGLPVVIVARPGLGTINHTLLTISVLRERKIPIAGIVVNYAEEIKPGLAEETSHLVIEKISGVPILAIVQFGGNSFKSIMNQIFYL